MKKLLLVVFIFLMLGFGFIQKSDDSFLNKFLGLNFNYVISYSSEVNDENLIDVGFIKIGNYKSDELNKINSNISEYIASETIILNKIEEDEVLSLLQAKVKKVYFVEDIKVMLCYVETLSKESFSNGVKFNLQIAINEEEIKVGYPTIAEGF